MLLKTSHAKLFSVLGALAFAALYRRTIPLPRLFQVCRREVSSLKLIKEGFKGTEGPIGYSDGSLLFTETNDNRIVRIAPDNTVSTLFRKLQRR